MLTTYLAMPFADTMAASLAGRVIAAVDPIGRRCKAMAKPKAAANNDASEAAAVVENVAAAEPSPWVDMDDVSDVWTWCHHLHIVPSSGTGMPCTSCHRQHVGPCTLEDLLIEDMNTMQFYAEDFLPAGPWHHHLRASLYNLMAEIYRVVHYEEPHVVAERFAVLRNAVMNLKVQCDLHVELGN